MLRSSFSLRTFSLRINPPPGTNESYTLYASHSTWNSKEDFEAWTKSEAFRLAHKEGGQHNDIYLGHPEFEGFEVII